ncbi:ImmA/IrrE family metallo-endopeptidase [Mycetocola saprophilus]|uniref:ImmA/IrrE family metallo-endopeptidase n=1 Tax=Mycetocola saprophilus TaxID=76636 RepID=UPI0004C2AB5A
MYDPHTHAYRLGVRVHHREIGSPTGLWVPRLQTIFLRPGMTARHERSVLAHEVAHVVLGHSDTSRKQELAADAMAARNLVDPRALSELTKWTHEIPELAIELGVTEKVIRTYLKEEHA